MYDKYIDLKIDKTLKYQYFMDKQHPLSSKTGRVYYHRHVVSLNENRWIGEKEVIHHIDGNRLNNSLDNLAILSQADHIRLHIELRMSLVEPKNIIEIKNIIKKITEVKEKECPQCHKMFRPSNKVVICCSTICSSIKSRKVIRPDIEIVKMDVKNLGLRGAGKKYGVSDNAVKKWIRNSNKVSIV